MQNVCEQKKKVSRFYDSWESRLKTPAKNMQWLLQAPEIVKKVHSGAMDSRFNKTKRANGV